MLITEEEYARWVHPETASTSHGVPQAVGGGRGIKRSIWDQVDELTLKILTMETDKFQRDVDRTQFYASMIELYERMRKVEELGAVVEGHTHTLETKASMAASEHDRAAMAALVERVKALEKPWYGQWGNTRIRPEADMSRLLYCQKCT